ncbi:MAG: carbamoyltransferase C-terminal domain-containing protein [Candidatus Omnitrophica bacterium]|nr:carbamoyltransferase C-terminal domain-containing protein [Candidatus Omnitrophota bacterium]
MHILTLHEDTNANITLFKDTQILFSVAEERLSRVKYKGGFPVKSLNMALDKHGLSLKDIRLIICGNKYHFLPRILWDKFPSYEHSFLGTAQKISVYYQHALFKNKFLRKSVESFNKFMLKNKLNKPVALTDHHTAHAYSAYLTSGFDKAVTITTDNFGDGLSCAVFTCENGICRLLYGSSALYSPGQFYGEIAQTLGFHPLLAGKMTGLAGYGDPQAAYDLMKGLFALSKDKKDFKLPALIWKFPGQGIYRKLRKYKKEDIAAAAQRLFEEVMLDYVVETVKNTGVSSLALAGGVFGNVRLNQKISELKEIKEVFIHPGMSDQGISLGVGLKYLAENLGLKPFKLKDVYWGAEYSSEEIKEALKKERVNYEYVENIESAAAKLLSAGKTVARFNGRMEYGPRALGNRSILYQTTDPKVNDWLNKKLNRAEFMPFAPVTLEEYAEKCYKNTEKVKHNMKFMTISIYCTEWMKSISPAVVHVDGTARPQIINEDDNQSYYNILKEYHRITGIPSLINTSFNMHEEPIVSSPDDAIRAFRAAKLDYLAIGNYLISQ